jgi:hypothetical protein
MLRRAMSAERCCVSILHDTVLVEPAAGVFGLVKFSFSPRDRYVEIP